ncbi:MarR family winged helix-turn-helix transcriptional regulator [Saccharopolyspora sp. MS10]|uniref:MarR family winged helix-turn-helix transcriptional regulator n=1 Tax=Saccharopolyspora sp. MS10 TaxID=3385973 RepID=UPI0039A11EFA
MSGEPSGADPGPMLSPPEQRLWRDFLRFSGDVISAVERELFAATGLSGSDFQVLARLHEADGHRMSQKELGELTGWTATRLSHQLARMRQRELVDRTPGERGRLMAIALTDPGRRAYESAVPPHAAAVRAHFLRHFDDSATEAARSLFGG